MKHILVSCFFFLLCYNVTEAQTKANIPGPENVLVVYNSLDQTSIDIKEYYISARNIPAVNVVGLENLMRKEITINGVMHPVVIA